MTLLIDNIDHDTSPTDIRGLLGGFGKVDKVVIDSEVSDEGEGYATHALADMLSEDADEACDRLHGRPWREYRISVRPAAQALNEKENWRMIFEQEKRRTGRR